jgi:hypothetical protein
MTLPVISQIVAAREAGNLIVEVRADRANTVDQAAEIFGLAATPGVYFEIEAGEATAILTEVLSFDMAYHCELMPRDDAERLANAFVDLFAGEGGVVLHQRRVRATKEASKHWAELGTRDHRHVRHRRACPCASAHRLRLVHG